MSKKIKFITGLSSWVKTTCIQILNCDMCCFSLENISKKLKDISYTLEIILKSSNILKKDVFK